MLASFFLKGWIIGFSIAMPLGPIGLLCLRHSLMRGLLCGLVAGLGVAFADAIYGALAGVSIGIISNMLITHQFWLKLGGAAFMSYLGVSTFRSRPNFSDEKSAGQSLLRIFLSMFTITLTNPMTLLCIAGGFVGLGVCTADQGLPAAMMVTGGVLVGSAAWWLLLSCGVSLVCRKVPEKSVHWLNRVSGVAILSFAALALISALQQLFYEH